MKRWFWLLAACFPLHLWADIPSNFDVLIGVYERYIQHLLHHSPVQRCDSVSIEFTPHAAAPILRNRFIHLAHPILPIATFRARCHLSFSIEHFEVVYYPHPRDEDSLLCLFRWKIFPVLTINGRTIPLAPLDTTTTLVSARKDIPLREQPSYPFTTAALPANAGNSFWNQIGVPLLFLTSSALAVILFFTLRSQ